MLLSSSTQDEKVEIVRNNALGIVHLLGTDEVLIEEAFRANKDVVRFLNPNLMTYEILNYYSKHYGK